MRASNPSHARGFTLIEVLAALVIVSLGMLGVIEAISQTASNSSRMRDRTLAHWVAMNQLTTVRLQTQAPGIGKTSDEVEMAGRRWRWTMEVSETPVESMRRIDVRVSEADVGDDRTLATVTGFYGGAIATVGMLTPSWNSPPLPEGPGAGRDRQGRDDNEPPPGSDSSGDGERTDSPLPERQLENSE